jgi:hypothetical protein
MPKKILKNRRVRKKKQFCRNGHNTFVTGRTPGGQCTICRKLYEKEYRKTKKYKKWRKNYKKQFALYQKEYGKRYAILNKDKIRKRRQIWNKKNKKKRSDYNRRWYKAHKKQKLAKNRQWAIAHSWLRRLSDLKQHTKRKKRIPVFGQIGIITFYRKCSKTKVVDHVIPLCGEKVSGLHVRWNLQYMTKKKNSQKHNFINLEKASRQYGKLLEKLKLK